jgi:hypothetical protein
MNYDGKTFRAVENTPNGEVSGETLFHYRQEGRLVTATYAGGGIVSGHLLALVDADGGLDMRYHHLNRAGELQTGVCRSFPEVLPDGRLRLHETWQWTSGDGSSGSSIVEEITETIGN